MSRTITFAALKGGVGKTTLSYHFAWYLATQHPDKKVLMIDLDHQGNLSKMTKRFMTDEQIAKSDIADVFESDAKKGEIEGTGVEPQRLNVEDDAQLYALTANSRLSGLDYYMVSVGKNDGSTLIGYLLANDYYNKFDYIVIDTHPNLEDVYVKGALVASDDVFTPIEPSDFGMDTVVNMAKRYRELQRKNVTIDRKPLITARLHWLANLVKFMSCESLDFLQAVRNNDNFIAYFHERSVFNKSTFSSEYVMDYIDSRLDGKRHPSSSDVNAKREILNGFNNMEQVISNKAQVRDEDNGQNG